MSDLEATIYWGKKGYFSLAAMYFVQLTVSEKRILLDYDFGEILKSYMNLSYPQKFI